MPNQHEQQIPIFGDQHRLQLLQLMTRRAMQERRAVIKEPDTDETSAKERRESPPATDPSLHWCLVPEGFSLYDWQRECLPLWLSKGRGTVKVATGGGKTLLALAVAQHLQNEPEPDLRLVVVVPTIPLMFQWYDEICRSNLPHACIGLMGGGHDLPPLSDIRVLICVLNSARERLPEIVTKAGWAQRMLLVVDECHRANAAQARRIFEANPKYTLGLSATPEQDVEAEALPTNQAYENSVVGRALGPIIYDFTIQDCLAAGLLTPFEVWHIGLSLSPQETSEHTRLSREITELRRALQLRHHRSRSSQGFLAWCQTQVSRNGPAAPEAERFIGLANRRKRLLYRATARVDVTLGMLAESMADLDGRTIVFHESIEEIETLFLRTDQNGLPAVLEHSQLPDSLRGENVEAFRQGVARVIISAKSLVEGFNVPSADLGIIMASTSSVRQRIQSLGRMLRRKPGGRRARIVVLYVRDTEDEAIYEKADWENVVGAERNRYFHWHAQGDDDTWTSGLEEISTPPRSYRPPSWEIDGTELKMEDEYAGQTHGVDLRVDQARNLRTGDGALVAATRQIIEKILGHNPNGRARCTPAGHLIVRVDTQQSDGVKWLFLGRVNLPAEEEPGTVIRLRLKTISGRRVIALENALNRTAIRFALGSDSSRTPEAGQARDRLLNWVQSVESTRGTKIRELFWDRKTSYWLEIAGERLSYDGPIAPLEFEL